jgi:hypothetical protein
MRRADLQPRLLSGRWWSDVFVVQSDLACLMTKSMLAIVQGGGGRTGGTTPNLYLQRKVIGRQVLTA